MADFPGDSHSSLSDISDAKADPQTAGVQYSDEFKIPYPCLLPEISPANSSRESGEYPDNLPPQHIPQSRTLNYRWYILHHAEPEVIPLLWG